MAKLTLPNETFYGKNINAAFDDAQKTIAVAPEFQYTFYNLNASGTYVLKTVPGFLHGVAVNTAAAGATSLYDATSATNPIGVLKASIAEGFYQFDCKFSTGLCVVVGHNDQDVTIIFRPDQAVSVSPSVSPSVSISPSLSPSFSPSKSPSFSPSLSPSISPSVSLSPSFSPSKSPSVSPSVSISPSVSPSRSVSPSVSPS